MDNVTLGLLKGLLTDLQRLVKAEYTFPQQTDPDRDTTPPDTRTVVPTTPKDERKKQRDPHTVYGQKHTQGVAAIGKEPHNAVRTDVPFMDSQI